MSEIAKLIPRIFLGVVCLIVSRAAFEVFHLCGWYPELQLADIVMVSPQTSIWSISAIAAISIWVGLDYLFYRWRPPLKTQPIATDVEIRAVANASALIGSPFQIEFGNGDKYERAEQVLVTGIFRRLIYVSVFNESMDDISDCNVRLIAATPRPKTGDNPTTFPVPFGANFDLRGKQRKFIKIVSFAENPGGNPSALERDNIIFSAASGGFFPGWTTIPIPSEDNPAILTLEAFAYGIESRTAHLHIWVDRRCLHAKII